MIHLRAYFAMKQTLAEFSSQKTEYQRCFYNPAEHLRWNFFANIVNDFQPLTIFANKLCHRCSARFYKRLWLFLNPRAVVQSCSENFVKV